MAKTVVGLYSTLDGVRGLIQDLQNNWVRREDISLVIPNGRGEFERYTQSQGLRPLDGFGTRPSQAPETAAMRIIAHMVTGLGVVDIQGVGQVVVAGPMVGAFARPDPVVGGLVGALIHAGVPEGDAERYTWAVRQGNTLVTVHAAEGLVDRVIHVMAKHDPVDTRGRDGQSRAERMEMAPDMLADDTPYMTEDLDQDHTLGQPVQPIGEQNRSF
jgi:hypothetical protein